ncbi:MAG TPA: addiction module protein [Terriglobales bacterium]|nr:addiction module protein [Terriglobales bacterium]
MARTVEQLAKQAMELPDLLVESLDTDEISAIDRAWLAEATRRRDEVRVGQVEAIDGEEARQRVRDAIRR